MIVSTRHNRRLKIAASVAIILLGGALLFIAASFITGYNFRLLNFTKSLPGMVRALMNHQNVAGLNDGDYHNIFFLHHSVGEGLIVQGELRERFAQGGYSFWDQGYNQEGVKDPSGMPLGYSYTVPNDNTDPDGLAMVFSQPVYSAPINTLSQVLQYEVIIVKSCFPVNNVTSDQQLEQYKAFYLTMRKTMDQHSNKLFILLTTPPLNPAETTPDAAKRAAVLANWLKSDEFVHGHSNLVVYDLYGQLAEDNPQASDFGMLRQLYRDGADSHPNNLANQTVAPQLVDFVINAIERYKHRE